MKEDFEKLNQERKANVEKAFASSSGVDQFFLHVLDGFSYRYITDEKSSQAEIQVPSKAKYVARNTLESMKRALELANPEQKQSMVQAMKEYMGKGKPTTQFQIQVDASDLNDDGKGVVKSKCIVDWGFPEHNGQQVSSSEKSFESEDWDHLRKHYPLLLDDLCELF